MLAGAPERAGGSLLHPQGFSGRWKLIWVLPGLVGAAEQGFSCPWHGGCCPQGPKSLRVTLGRKSLPEAVSSHSIQPLQRQICSSKGPLEDAGGQDAARAGPTCTEERPRALWGLWGQLVALPSSEWMAEGAPGAPALPAGIRQGAGSSGSSRWLLLINRLGSFMCPRAACATGAGSWLRASWGSLHPSWRIPGLGTQRRGAETSQNSGPQHRWRCPHSCAH